MFAVPLHCSKNLSLFFDILQSVHLAFHFLFNIFTFVFKRLEQLRFQITTKKKGIWNQSALLLEVSLCSRITAHERILISLQPLDPILFRSELRQLGRALKEYCATQAHVMWVKYFSVQCCQLQPTQIQKCNEMWYEQPTYQLLSSFLFQLLPFSHCVCL